MERIIELLERKNQYLEKFYVISEAELLNFQSGDFMNLESFYECRDKILNIIRHIDEELDKVNQQFSDQSQVSGGQKVRARRELSLKEGWVNRILELDLQIISCIEAAKSSIIKELQTVRKGRKAVSGYKAESGPSYRLNEEI